MRFSIPFFLFVSLFLISILNFAQEKREIYFIKDSLNYNLPIYSSPNFNILKEELSNNGYFFYKITSIKKDSIHYHAITPNTQTKTVAVHINDKTVNTIVKSKKGKHYLLAKDTPAFIKNITDEFDKKGLNFTQIKFTNQQLKNDTLFCDLSIEKSNKRYINKVVVKGYKRFSKRFVKRYLYTKKVFSKELLTETENKINQLSFVKNRQKPAVLFTKDSTHLYVYLDRVKANKLDALIGFSNQEGSSKIQFNGHIDISLTNTLHKGETLAFKWNNSGQDQQEIDLFVDNPYLFNSPVDVTYNLNIFRQDSSFVNTKHQLKLGYKPHYRHTVGIYYNKERSTSIDDISPEYTKDLFGLTYLYQKINSWRIPKAKIAVDIGYGTRDTDIAATQQTLKTDVIYNFELNLNNHVYTQNRNAYLRSDNRTNNELYRLGGATTIRGFLEQSIVSHLYNFTNVEYRYFNNPISYLYAFTDFGHFRNLSTENNLISLGLGYTLGTKSGLLKISYAVGKSDDTSFNLSNGLFHINFVTIF